MATEPADDERPTRPRFRGCIVCYGAEWAYYGAKRAVDRVND